MIVTCDECKQKVDIQPQNINTVKTKRGIEEVYFECPNCKERFLVALTNKEIRRLQFIIQTTPTNLREPLQKRLRIAMDKLNGKAE